CIERRGVGRRQRHVHVGDAVEHRTSALGSGVAAFDRAATADAVEGCEPTSISDGTTTKAANVDAVISSAIAPIARRGRQGS
ncbi:MAG TPA: hypothetical protein VLI21_09175, partial [Casimicrobiaceae bacterium]|nr:hypothetical protein [Casimicrobiaceae bacterium]